MNTKAIMRNIFALTGIANCAPTLAHTIQGQEGGIIAGILHPLSGVDHLFVAITVVYLAFRLGGNALWQIPCAFFISLFAGVTLGVLGASTPIALWALVFAIPGVALVLKERESIDIGIALISVVTVFHGYTHGATIADMANVEMYLFGLLITTISVTSLGVYCSLLCKHIPRSIVK